MFLTHLSQLTTFVMAGVCALAVLTGRWPERLVAVAYSVNWIGSALGQDRRLGHHGQPVIFALDALLLALLLGLTLSCRRTWLIWMSACSLLVVLAHVVVLLDVRFGQWAYQTVYYVWSMGALAAFGLGVLIEGRRPVSWLFKPGRSIPNAMAQNRS